MNTPQTPLIAVIGPTAVGKTELVLKIAARLGAEIVSVDSMQVYRHMDIGTAKPSLEEQRLIRHHLINMVNPDQDYNLATYINDAEKICTMLSKEKKVALLTGGTGLYLKGFQDGLFSDPGPGNCPEIREKLNQELIQKGREALFNRLQTVDAASASRIHPNDTTRLLRALEIYETTGTPWSTHLLKQPTQKSNANRRIILKIGLNRPRKELYNRINQRSATMLRQGLIEEVETLLSQGYSRKLKPLQAIGYRHVIEFLDGHKNRDETELILARDTRHYAKRQLTWFLRDEEIQWHHPSEINEIIAKSGEFLDSYHG
ncbi:MAG: tRNA (adenosine(37)-N6)-dimethylallyltransferase MiaA [Proteobacteria bacterium]|nr:tRNA (adenosine(37)-N6)-dimethylallyltransferase MiaA [Pseudomonadota bacterium]MBU1686518.1 tRNA (adenosine(37)-N6)-dimethylallyltransferase MiaA [Pseudomonadota bacterium]